MGDLLLLLQTPPSVIVSYVAIGLAGVSVTLIVLSQAFARRHAPVLFFVYFTIKAIVDSLFWYALAEEGIGLEFGRVVQMQSLWTHTLAIVSMLVIWLTFEGDLLSVAVCALFTDLVAGVITWEAHAIYGFVTSGQLKIEYISPFGPRTVFVTCFILVMAYAIRRPFGWLLRWMCRLTLRWRAVLTVVSVASLAYYMVATQETETFTNMHRSFYVVVPYALIALVVMLLVFVWNARQVRRREETVRAVHALAASYDATVREQLGSLEESLMVLDGHEGALGQLESDTDSGFARHVEQLRTTYRALSSGAFCDRPALDAALTACASRLEEQGVCCAFTVAGVPARSVVPATTAFALLNLASEAAGRTGTKKGDAVELRVRGVGEQVSFRMEVPARWGTLWARRLLTVFREQECGLVRERVQGNRTVVLAVCEGVSS